MKPDYKKYSLVQLKEALHSIDREKWPERVKEIENILNDPKAISKLTNQERKKIAEPDINIEMPRIIFGIFMLISACVLAVKGDLIGRHGVVHIETPALKWFLTVLIGYVGFRMIAR